MVTLTLNKQIKFAQPWQLSKQAVQKDLAKFTEKHTLWFHFQLRSTLLPRNDFIGGA